MIFSTFFSPKEISEVFAGKNHKFVSIRWLYNKERSKLVKKCTKAS